MSPAYTIKRRKKRFRTKLGTSGYLTENSETNLKYTWAYLEKIIGGSHFPGKVPSKIYYVQIKNN